jgi:hypothetical protein
MVQSCSASGLPPLLSSLDCGHLLKTLETAALVDSRCSLWTGIAAIPVESPARFVGGLVIEDLG